MVECRLVFAPRFEIPDLEKYSKMVVYIRIAFVNLRTGKDGRSVEEVVLQVCANLRENISISIIIPTDNYLPTAFTSIYEYVPTIGRYLYLPTY